MCAVALSHSDVAGMQIVDIRRNNMRDVKYHLIEVPVGVAAHVRALIASYGLRFAAIDFGVTAVGEWNFFEINPNGQWAWPDLIGATNLWEGFVHAFR